MLALAATTMIDIRTDEPALLTLTEYLRRQNPDGKFHSESAYDWDLARAQHMPVDYLSVDWDKYRVKRLPSGFIILRDIESETVVGYIENNVLFLAPDARKANVPYSFRQNPGFGSERESIDYSEVRQVKYPARVADARLKSEQAAWNRNRFPILIQRVKLSGHELEIRAEKVPKQDNGDYLVVLNLAGLVVASASDEWGATLVHVVREYRGFGIGPVLTELWYKYNPGYRSGGYSAAGRNQAAKVWSSRVRTFLDRGWYSELVREGKLSKEKVTAILADLKARPSKHTVVDEPAPKSVCIFTDDTQFVVFYRDYLKTQDDADIIGYGFIRENSDLGIYFYRIEWDAGHEKLVNTVAMQFAYDIGEPVYVGETHADLMDLSEVENVVVEDKRARLTKPAFDLKHASSLTKKILRKEDPTHEIQYQLIEDADSKWR